MPLFRRSRWRDPEHSCGRGIINSLLTRKKAWYAEGPALKKYQDDVEAIVHDVFRSIGLDRAEVYFRLYMIGSATRSSEPTIMVCCMNSAIRSRVKDELRGTLALQSFPEFQIHGLPHPLEQRTPAQTLARTSFPSISSESSDKALLDDNDVYSQSTSLSVGRSLLRGHHAGELAFWATGGVFLLINGNHYQLTSEHECDFLSMRRNITSQLDLDTDALSVNGSNDEDYGHLSDEETLRANFDVLSQGSITPTSGFSRSSISLAQSADSSWDEEILDRELVLSHIDRIACPVTINTLLNPDGLKIPIHNNHKSQYHNTLDGPPYQPSPSRIGSIAFRASEGSRPELDYVLISTPAPTVSDLSNRVTVPHEDGYRCIYIRDVASTGLETQEVYLIGNADTVRRGFLVPGFTLFQNPDFSSVQRLQVVQLDEGEFTMGDSGTAVIDQQSGSFYGHVIRGCPGSRTGYIVPAIKTFHDLSSMERSPKLRFEDTCLEICHGEDDDRPEAPAHGTKVWTTMKDASTQTTWRLPPTPPESQVGDVPVEVAQSPSDLIMLMEELDGADDGDVWASFFDPHEERSLHKISFLRDFCRGATIESLNRMSCPRLNIWLDQEDYGKQARYPHSKLLSAGDLLRVLKLKTMNDASYLDRWAALVLAATSYRKERLALSDGIYRHLTSRAYLNFSTDHSSSTSFCLELHLPYWVWRRDKEFRRASRDNGVLTPLRQSIKVFRPLSTHQAHPQEKDIWHLHQAHLSCIIVGEDEKSWKAYTFADTFFANEPSIRELTSDASESQGGLSAYPSIFGRRTDKRLWDPRRLFHREMNFRLQSITWEWENLACQFQIMFIRDTEIHTPSKAGDSTIDIDWPGRMCSVLTQSLSTLSATLETLEEKKKTYELHSFVSSNTSSPLHEKIRLDLKKTCDDLNDCQRSLYTLREILVLEQSRIQAKQSLRLALDQDNSVTLLSWVTIITQPLVLAASIFACGDLVLGLPITSPPLQFLALLLCANVVLLVIVFLAPRIATRRSVKWGASRPPVVDIELQRDSDEGDSHRQSPSSSPIVELPDFWRPHALAPPPALSGGFRRRSGRG
ncbi:hypothetical protein BDP81DRAFT_498961 [Colletotrichum phormii]|uniref:Uncharacterized protein n=1 Tax=Colletotrichum phormii TaxID=359342 RepID=A0AAI9ZIV9_9PEZI|nr:uncharacterized protein BDP81DRAFT_498961 [Colletotrichum phormii]KAK1625414.1 hypothetical protein BDP81DRAFT_498961 [Colletotrichum phormii]